MRSSILRGLVFCAALVVTDASRAQLFDVSATPTNVYPGESITVQWDFLHVAPTLADRIGLFEQGAADADALTYENTDGAFAGEAEFIAPYAAGIYEFRYLYGEDPSAQTAEGASNSVEVLPSSGPRGDGRSILLLSGGNFNADAAVQSALEAHGFNVTTGPSANVWDGSQADLSQYAAVFLATNYNWSYGMPEPGLDALVDFVLLGGGLVTGEWTVWSSYFATASKLQGVLPIGSYCGFSGEASTMYSRQGFDPLIHDGMPQSFTINMVNLAGTESCFQPRQNATVFYTSSNGGGTPGAAGLLGWNRGWGRVISFSNLMTHAELASPDLARLLGNAAEWAAQGPCITGRANADAVAQFGNCLTGPDEPVMSGCQSHDYFCSGSIDLRDVATFQRVYETP